MTRNCLSAWRRSLMLPRAGRRSWQLCGQGSVKSSVDTAALFTLEIGPLQEYQPPCHCTAHRRAPIIRFNTQSREEVVRCLTCCWPGRGWPTERRVSPREDPVPGIIDGLILCWCCRESVRRYLTSWGLEWGHVIFWIYLQLLFVAI